MSHDDDARFARALHRYARERAVGESLAPPIVPATMYHLPGDPAGPYQYGRWANPTWQALEEMLAELEDAPVVAFPSGMAAVSAVMFSLLKPGDRVLLPSDGYYTTRAVAEKYLVPAGIHVATCPTADAASADVAGFRMVWLETPSNPGLDVADIGAVADRAHAAGACLVVDNTTLTPLGQRPFDCGADIVVSSDTKAMNGHSDVLMGHVAARDAALLEPVRDWRRYAGAVPGQFEAWLVHRGLETLEVRFSRMCANAAAVAARFAEHPKVKAVRHPTLPSHPARAVVERQMRAGGPLVALTFADKAAAERFIGAAKLVRPATSFGGVHTSAERRARWGDAVPEGFVRLSVGCEPLEALWADLSAALQAV